MTVRDALFGFVTGLVWALGAGFCLYAERAYHKPSAVIAAGVFAAAYYGLRALWAAKRRRW